MRILFLLTLAVVASTSLIFAGTLATPETIPPVTIAGTAPPRKTMKSFRSEREMERYFQQIVEKEKRARRQREADAVINNYGMTVQVSASQEPESVTNTQHEGVDEGGIVKVHGDHLVILRRGRLFTVAIGDGDLRPIASIDAFGPDVDPKSAWYDEMLVSEDTIIVIGYSYERGGTEVGFFSIDAAGQLMYRSTYHLRSNDYYSARNYASRLIGRKLIFYSPLYFDSEKPDWLDSFPAMRRWHKGAKEEEFRRIVAANRVYVPEGELTLEEGITLHTVTTCDLAYGGFDCKATTVVGPSDRVFYVSPDSVYIWATSWSSSDRRSLLFRMPLDGSAPSALRVSGGPTDQFSFLQSDDQHLNVLVRAEGQGDGMWASEVSRGDVALLRVSLGRFSDGSEEVPAANYRRLPQPQGYGFQNRFVGDYVLYGTDDNWNPYNTTANKEHRLYVVEWTFGKWQRVDLPHTVDRIEQMGANAVVVGSEGKDLHFSAIRLGKEAEIVSRYTRKEASQGELRSHGFFYKPDGNESGTLGLPISVPARPGYQHLFDSSAAILFLRNESRQFREAGELVAQSEKAVDDKCRASCVDWYGNSRPLFLRNRVFALLGYELVEGKIDAGRIREVRRINYFTNAL